MRRLRVAILIAVPVLITLEGPLRAIARAETATSAAPTTSVTSAGNIPYSGVSPGHVDMATGELAIVHGSDLGTNGPIRVVFGRYYGSMLAREGLASGHLGPNWLGTYDWSLSVATPMVNVVTNRGQLIQFQQSGPGGYVLVAPMDEKYQLAFVGGTWRFTHPGMRRVFLFDGTSHLLTQILDESGSDLSLSYITGEVELLSQATDGLGRTLTFSYDATGLLTQVSDGTRSVGYSYTGGLLTGVTDAAGNAWSYAYAGPSSFPGLLTGVTEPLGNTPLTQAYDPLGRVVTQTDALGHVATYTYDSSTGNAIYTEATGGSWTYMHDPLNRLATLTDPAAGVTSFAYDPPGRLASLIRPMGDATSLGYDPASGYPSTLTLADGSTTSWGYSSHGVSGATLFDLATAGYADGTTESYGRDAAGNLTDFIDRGGFLWSGTYNARGQPLSATNSTGGTRTFTYDPQARLASSTDNAGNATAYAYDGLSRLTQVTWPDGQTRSFAYDVFVHVTGLVDERGKLWSYAYDANGRLTTVTDPLIVATGIAYDALDRLTQVTDPLGHSTGYAYDDAGRLMSTTDRTGRITLYAHDSWGHLTGITDPAGGTYSFSYDADSRVISGLDPLGHVVLLGHDFLDRVTHVTDPVGTGFDYTYDSMGRLLSASAPLGHTETFGYDPRGLLTSFFDVTSEVDFARTPLGEVSKLTDPNRNAWPATYDPQGRPTSAADPLGRTTSLTYDGRSRVTHAVLPLGSVDLTYDAASRLGGRMFSDGTPMTYSYDDANRLTGGTGAAFVYDAAGRMTASNGLAMTYDNEGRIASETYAPGKVVSYTYDSRGLLTQVTDWVGGATAFSYDAAGRLAGITRPDGTTAAYGYDAADRLITSVETRDTPDGLLLASITLTRDALGQPTSMNRRQPLMPGVTSPATTEYTYDAASQINGLTWDPLGRLVSDGARTFEWDGASRLTHYVAGTESPTFTYDAFGSMLTRTQGAVSEQYVWNYATATPTLAISPGPPSIRYFVYTPSGTLLHSIDAAGARLFYHYDEAGNTMFLTNSVGSVVTEYAYTPFGGGTAVGQTTSNLFTFDAAAGAIQLGSSGLFRMGGGIYDASTMRMISGNWVRSVLVVANVAGRDPDTGDPVPFPEFGVASPGSWVTRNPGPSSTDAVRQHQILGECQPGPTELSDSEDSEPGSELSAGRAAWLASPISCSARPIASTGLPRESQRRRRTPREARRYLCPTSQGWWRG